MTKSEMSVIRDLERRIIALEHTSPNKLQMEWIAELRAMNHALSAAILALATKGKTDGEG